MTLSFSHYTYSGTKRLRLGYTTGSCAALAAQAATAMLLEHREIAEASINTPAGLEVSVELEDVSYADNWEWVSCGVRKDAGDDVDATDGLLISARACKSDISGVTILGGKGVGRVTKPGLDQAVGEAAINRVPREMITKEVQRICREHDVPCAIEITISAEDGIEAARKTFNPNLGIEGGISILGTTGIVEPRSLAALRDSIELEIRQKHAEGSTNLIVVPGNYGLDFVRNDDTLSKLSEAIPVVTCSNFIGDAIDFAAREGFERLLLVGHFGKMAKVAAGVMDTHSHVADCRVEIICAHAAVCGASTKLCRELMNAATTDACVEILDKADMLSVTMDSMSLALDERLKHRAAAALEIGAVVFSNKRGELFRTPSANSLVESMGEESVLPTCFAKGEC